MSTAAKLADDFTPTAMEPWSVELIIRVTAQACNVTPLDILSQRREPRTVLARHTAMWLAHKLTLRTYVEIARAFNRHEHSAVRYAVRRIDEAMEDDPAFARQVWALVRMFEAADAG
jgi:chromosomal replication initiator protein